MDGVLEADRSPAVTVIVPHYEDFDRLDRCLTALAAQDFGERVQIVVADNNSPGGADRVAAAVAGRAVIVTAALKGAGAARNAGVAAATGRVLAFTDADCLPDRGWLSAGMAAVRPAVIVGGRMVVLSEEPRSPTECFELVFAFDNEHYVKAKGFSVTANLFVERELFDRVGPFRTGISEDVDWCWRAGAAGAGIVYCAAAVVGHPARRDWRQLENKWLRLSQETYLLDRERGKSRAWLYVRTWAMLFETPRAILRAMRSTLLTRAERTKAALVLVRVRLYRFVLFHRLIFGRHVTL